MQDEPPARRKARKQERVALTSTFKPRELLCIDRETGETRFVEPRVPDGISLRNFGIQVVSVFCMLPGVFLLTMGCVCSRSLRRFRISSCTRPGGI